MRIAFVMKIATTVLLVTFALSLGACKQKETRDMQYQRTTTGYSK